MVFSFRSYASAASIEQEVADNTAQVRLCIRNMLGAHESEVIRSKIDSRSFTSFNAIFALQLSSVSISLIVEHPQRRELLHLVVDGIEAKVQIKPSQRSFEFSMRDIWLDNYSETAVTAVMLHTVRERDTLANTPLFYCGIMEEFHLVSVIVAVDLLTNVFVVLLTLQLFHNGTVIPPVLIIVLMLFVYLIFPFAGSRQSSHYFNRRPVTGLVCHNRLGHFATFVDRYGQRSELSVPRPFSGVKISLLVCRRI